MKENKQTKEERLEKKRLAEKLRRARIKNDPKKYEEEMKKARERYWKKKADKKIVPMRQLSKKKRKKLRDRNKINARTYRARKLQLENASQIEQMMDVDIVNQSQDPLSCSTQSLPFQSESVQNENKELLNNYAETHSRAKQQSVSCSRLLTRNLRTNLRPSSTSPVTHLSRSRERVPKRLNYDIEPLSSSPGLSTRSASSNISSASSISEKAGHERQKMTRKHRYKMNKELKVLHKRIEELTHLNSKYRKQVSRLRNTIIPQSINNNNPTESDSSCNNEDERKYQDSKDCEKYKVFKSQIEESIRNFYLDDDNSRMCPGKKEYITFKKIKKQKRYLSESIQNLHKKFNKIYPHLKVSYSYFWKLKPFWVLTPNLKIRDTCMCKQHENMDLMVDCLKKNNIIHERTSRDVLTYLCCNSMDPKCLSRDCDECQSKNLNYKEFDNSKIIKYWSWKTEKKEYIKDGQTKTAIQSVKVPISAAPKDVIQEFENMLKPYLQHCSNIVTQSAYIKKLKSSLTEKEAVVHCDFSENYSLKYSSEIQALHFGGSRQQVTLHTVVIYFLLDGNLQTQAFCTMSQCLRHDAVAVWEHLMPVLRFIEDNAPSVDAIHFVSDSPSGQYRNRNLFFIISKLHWHYPSLRNVSWNYSESGHGKGAPDGVGAVLKRTADQIVARGHDIPDLESLLFQLKSNVPGVIIEVIEESGILQKEVLIPTLKTFKGTMRVHQVVWDANNKFTLALRRLSCNLDACSTSAQCQHGYHIGFYNIGSQADLSEQNVANSTIICDKNPGKKIPDRTLCGIGMTSNSCKDSNISNDGVKTLTVLPTNASTKSYGNGPEKKASCLSLDHTSQISGKSHEPFSDADKSEVVMSTSDRIENNLTKTVKNLGQKENLPLFKRVPTTSHISRNTKASTKYFENGSGNKVSCYKSVKNSMQKENLSLFKSVSPNLLDSQPLKEVFEDSDMSKLTRKNPISSGKKVNILSNKLLSPIPYVPRTSKLTIKDASKNASSASNGKQHTIKVASKNASSASNQTTKTKKSKKTVNKVDVRSEKKKLNPIVQASTSSKSANSNANAFDSLIIKSDDDDFWGTVPSIDDIQVTPILRTTEMAHISNILDEDSDSSDCSIFDLRK